LAPWRGQLVYVGGWAHRIHRLDPRANPPSHQAVFTKDTDLAFAAAETIEGDIKAALEKSGFKERLSGEAKPPVAHYTLGAEGEGFYAEFLTPLAGSGRKRDGKPDATLAKAGISAQKIRHLDILLVDPWVVELNPDNAPVKKPIDIRVANPLAFMVQKFLIRESRPPKKRAQDILYIFDTVGLFGGGTCQRRKACLVAGIEPETSTFRAISATSASAPAHSQEDWSFGRAWPGSKNSSRSSALRRSG
jgi:hypothetical protein